MKLFFYSKKLYLKAVLTEISSNKCKVDMLDLLYKEIVISLNPDCY